MVAVSPEIDDNDLRIREGLLDQTLDFNSVHSHRDTLQRSVAVAMQAPNQLAKYPPRPRGWAAIIEAPGQESNFQDLSQTVRRPVSGFRHAGRGLLGMRLGSRTTCRRRLISFMFLVFRERPGSCFLGRELDTGATRKC